MTYCFLSLTFSPEFSRFANSLSEQLFHLEETIRQLLFKIKLLVVADELLWVSFLPFGQKLK